MPFFLKKKKRRYCYLLLEILVAIGLLSLFLAPILGSPFHHLKRQKQEILTLYLHRYGEEVRYLIEEQLRNGQISWKQIEESQKQPVEIASLSQTVSWEDGLPAVEVKTYIYKSFIKDLGNDTWIGTVRSSVEFFSLGKGGKTLYVAHPSFFVSKKKGGFSYDHSFSQGNDPICRVER